MKTCFTQFKTIRKLNETLLKYLSKKDLKEFINTTKTLRTWNCTFYKNEYIIRRLISMLKTYESNIPTT